MTKPLFSIIMPVYNVEHYLSESINSILMQSGDWELIIDDDGSCDNSSSICDYYKKIDNRINVFHKNNDGVSSARNYGIEKATGKYIVFVDSDDVIDINFLSII